MPDIGVRGSPAGHGEPSELLHGTSRLPDLSGVRPPSSRLMWVGRAGVRALLWSRFDTRVHGREHVPARGPVILASNHMGYADGPLVGTVTPRPVHSLVKEEIFATRLGPLMVACGQIRVDRFGVDMRAIRRCLAVLAAGRVLAIYPEGIRGVGDVAVARGGVGYLALVTGAPVVPVACLGTRPDGAPTSAMPARGARLDVVFGPPRRYDAVPWPRTKRQVAIATEEIRAALADHVRAACAATGQRLPALPASPSAEMSPAVQEESARVPSVGEASPR